MQMPELDLCNYIFAIVGIKNELELEFATGKQTRYSIGRGFMVSFFFFSSAHIRIECR